MNKEGKHGTKNYNDGNNDNVLNASRTHDKQHQHIYCAKVQAMLTTMKMLRKPKIENYESTDDNARRGKQEEVLNSRNGWIVLHCCKHCIALHCIAWY